MWIEVHKNGIRLSRYTYRCAVLPDRVRHPACHCAGFGLNAPTGARCSLTRQVGTPRLGTVDVSMHLQVRGAP